MLGIDKRQEPPSLRKFRDETPHASYTGYPDKKGLREALFEDQGGLCAYCMRRVYNTRDESGQIDFTIEHWSAQATDVGRDLHWPDMLGVCLGRARDERGEVHSCDKARGSRALSIHPARDVATIAARCAYLGDGRLRIDGQEEGDVATLNLNVASLRNGRREILDHVLATTRGADLTRLRALEAEWRRRSPEGLRRQYAGTALYLIQRAIHAKEQRSARVRGAR